MNHSWPGGLTYLVGFKVVRMWQHFDSVIFGGDRVHVSSQVVGTGNDDSLERTGSPVRSVALSNQVSQTGRQNSAPMLKL